MSRSRIDATIGHEGFYGNPEMTLLKSHKKAVDSNFDFDQTVYQKLSDKKKCEKKINDGNLLNTMEDKTTA